MKFTFACAILCSLTVGRVMAGGAEIVAAARSQIGIPYAWGGGGWAGKSLGVHEKVNQIIGFDCSGLAQYSVYVGTSKKIARVSRAQYLDSQCKHVPYRLAQAGDLVFFEDEANRIHHVAIFSGNDTMVHAPHAGDHVREGPVYTKGIVDNVQRCW